MRLSSFVASAVLLTCAVAPAAASDFYPPMQPPPAYNAAAFDFHGFYLGAQGGMTAGSLHSGSLGVVAGVNFDVADPVMAGIEFQGDWLPGSASSTTYDFFVLGRLGVNVTDNLMAYGDLGTGWIGGTGSYTFGGGAEYALTDQLAIKGEVLGVGAWGASPSAAKIQAGLIFHLH